jgi:hypothetical protein
MWLETAAMASANGGSLVSLNVVEFPSIAAGVLFSTPTAMVTEKMAVMIQTTPTHAIHPILLKVRILARRNVLTAAIMTKVQVQRAWLDTALSPTEIPSIADAEMKTQSV